MNIIKNQITKLATACACCILLSAPALALDTDAVLSRLEASLNANNIDVMGGNVTTDGNNIIVENFGIEAASLEGAEDLTLRLENIVEGADGSFTIGKLSVDDASLEIDGDQIDFTGFEIEQLHLPAESTSLYGNHYLPYQSIVVKSLTLYNRGKPGFYGSNVFARVSDFEADKRIAYQGGVEKISFDMENIGRESAEGMKEMGYSSITGHIEFAVKADYDTALVDIDNFAFSLDDIGTLSMKLQLGGYTQDVAQALSEMSANAGDNQAAGLALLGLAQQLTFNSFLLRFDDHSITNKALDYVGEQMGAARSDMINMAAAGAQFGLANLQHADFVLKVSQSLSTYLNDPQSIEVVATPAQPLSFMILAGAAQTPKSLIDMLNVEINANK